MSCWNCCNTVNAGRQGQCHWRLFVSFIIKLLTCGMYARHWKTCEKAGRLSLRRRLFWLQCSHTCHLSGCRVGTFKQARNCEGQRINLYHSEYKVTLTVSLWLSLQNNSETMVICVPYFGLHKLWGKHGETSKSKFAFSWSKVLRHMSQGVIAKWCKSVTIC